MEAEKIVTELKTVLIKIQNILSMMKQGEFIVAYEKLLGVNQKLSVLGGKIQSEIKPCTLSPQTDSPE